MADLKVGAMTTCIRPGCKNPPRPRKDPRARHPVLCEQCSTPKARQAAWRQRNKESKR